MKPWTSRRKGSERELGEPSDLQRNSRRCGVELVCLCVLQFPSALEMLWGPSAAASAPCGEGACPGLKR